MNITDDNNIEYTIQFKQYKEQLYTVIGYQMTACLLLFFFPERNSAVFMFAGLSVFSIFQLVLFLQYYLHDRKLKLLVDHTNSQISFIKDGNFRSIHFNEISEVIRYKGQYDEYNRLSVLPTALYHHTKIKLKNGDQLFFTDFIGKGILPYKIPYVEKLSFYNLML